MAGDNKSHGDTETMLLALDQISQTIDVMTSVVGRLRHQLREQAAATQAASRSELSAEISPDRILH